MRKFPDLEYPILPRYLTTPSKRRAGLLMSQKVRFLVAHDTGNSGSTAAGNVRYYESTRNQVSASAHLFVDDRQILECVPALTGPPEKAWHVLYAITEDNRRYGRNANDAAIGVEYCFGPNINADEAYRRYVWVLAYLCWKFKLDPTRDIVGHHILDPQRKTDPKAGLARSHRSYTQLLLDVPAMYARCIGKPAEVPPALDTVAGNVTTRTIVNIRQGEPFRRAPSRQVPAGASLPYLRTVQGENVSENATWYALPNNEFCWSGAVA
ncbi:MAG: amidase [Hymenobacter sp.]|jgi:N-acetylmuramoyl-L-alanine amidase|nr:amidase [Hymenobacter sp.]